MGRSTQFIGLTAKAAQLVADLEPAESDTQTMGMFEEKIGLRRWHCKSLTKRGKWVREKVQIVPWSSGPMIFTCLEIEAQNGSKCECMEWICDPRMKGREFDYEEGAYYV